MQPSCSNAANEVTQVADVKIGKVKGNSRMYPQLRLPSRYADLAGATASVYELDENGESLTFVIRIADHTTANNRPPCGGHDAGSNLALCPLFFFFVSANAFLSDKKTS